MSNDLERWVVTLRLEPEESLDERAARVVEYLTQDKGIIDWVITDLEALGPLGDPLSTQVEESKRRLQVTANTLLSMLRDGGQVIELQATVIREGRKLWQVVIRDGYSLDVLGSGAKLPDSVLGEYKESNPRDFYW